MMGQICAWFGDGTEKRIVELAETEDISKSKGVVILVERGLAFVDFERALREKDEQLGLALQNLSQFQNEIIPPLKLLLESKEERKKGLLERIGLK